MRGEQRRFDGEKSGIYKPRQDEAVKRHAKNAWWERESPPRERGCPDSLGRGKAGYRHGQEGAMPPPLPQM